MSKYNIDLEKLKSLNGLIGKKNEMSVLKDFPDKEITNSIKEDLISDGILNSDGSLKKEIEASMNVLANPYGIVKYIFTGGVGIYEHSISYDQSFKKNVQLILTPKSIVIDDELHTENIVQIMESFVGKSNLKSLNITYKLKPAEALVVAAMLDMERKSSLRAFVDEVVYSHNSYNANVIWRIVNSTNPSIQWFVYLVNEVIGEHEPLTQNQVQEAINQLLDKGIVTKNGDQYLLSDEFSMLSNRMIIIDNVVSILTYKFANTQVISSGFTCIQAGVHDLLLLDYDGSDIRFNTITSNRLIDYVKQVLESERYFNNIKAV